MCQFYYLQSRCLKNIDPTLIWSVRRDAFDCRLLKREQIINHYARAAFTTKVRSVESTTVSFFIRFVKKV